MVTFSFVLENAQHKSEEKSVAQNVKNDTV